MSLNGTVWAPIGPSPIDQGAILANGQVTAIAVNPNNPDIIFIGTAWGGVWRTRDGGTTWTPIFDRAPSLGVGEPGAIAIDPTNSDILYVGTSNRNGSQFSSDATQPSAGLFKSTDGGASWIRLGSPYPLSTPSNASIFFNQVINVVIVDPANSQIIYLASNRGLFVSTDGGFNWTQGTAPFGDARSLVLDPTSPPAGRILFAGITSVGVVQSTNGGQTWVTIVNATTPVVSTSLTAGGFSGFSKVVVALAPPTSPPNAAGIQVLYATMVGTGVAFTAPDCIGLFQSTDQGGTWTTRATAAVLGAAVGTSYRGYACHMAVDPASPGDGAGDTIYLGTLGQARSTDAGSTFAGLNGLHADTHAWGFAPQAGPLSVVYCGNDGGIFRCTAGVNFTSLNGGGFQATLFYNIDVKPDATASVTLGALQDNGIVTTAGAAAPTWKMGAGGDGFDVAHDGQLATQVYGRSNSTILRSTDDGDSYAGISPPWPPAEVGVFLAAVATDPNTSGCVYASSNQNLWQSTDGGATWPNTAPIPGTASEVDVAPTNSNNVVVTVGGRVLVSTDALVPGGFTLNDITRNLPGRFVGGVAFDPNDPATIYAVLGGFSGTPGGHVFRTSLTAATWTDISPPLDLPFNAIALDGTETPTALYTGTDFGVLRSVDGGANWSVLDDIHFPGAPVFELVHHQGELRAATFGRGVFSFVRPNGPSIAINLENDLEFGTVCKGPQFLTLEIFNVGVSDLVVTSVQRLMGSTGFSVLATPGTPLVIAAGEHVDFTVKYVPTGLVAEAATIRILSNDPTAPAVDLSVTGVPGKPRLSTAIADAGDFGNACLRSFVDKCLTLNNSGTCPLSVTGIASSSPEFELPSVLSYPLVLGAGDSIALPVRLRPASFGAKAATLSIFSDDPAGVHLVVVSGNAPAPELDLVIPDTGNFGKVCVDAFKDLPLTLINSGACTLTVTAIVSSAGEFLVPGVATYPIRIAPATAVAMPIRLAPSSFGAKSATITVNSDDPSGPKMVSVSGKTPAGRLVVTGSTCIGGVKECCLGERTIAICNIGECNLHVTGVGFKRKSRHWKLINNPFPATLHPGSCLNVLIRYKATEKCPRACELIITSDDPLTPVKTLDVMAYTIPNNCGCSKCCDDCRQGGCNKAHDACCNAQAIDGCCDDEGEECDDE
ncbi:choice-of-anchor D domain-containing protein [Phyllobacterium sp. SYP-B3895]|uniref:choice-of-anchor D domain-containing protein n=1 Tax=Phyllobacterium sp. SYP-B3895 TaxID=2663240 RepID=UPI001299AD68|nr:choice-of-anchor D domain-containing protein [Phyllobacterium sp. SYP-B3895]MRG58023.1 choice-of-anchor D domain-containing protein [Phyllobacterium sp. SYP-B3895]